MSQTGWLKMTKICCLTQLWSLEVQIVGQVSSIAFRKRSFLSPLASGNHRYSLAYGNITPIPASVFT